MKIVVSDIETNRVKDPDKLWLFGGIDVKTGERYRFDIETDPACRVEAIKWAESVDLWIGHKFLEFDAIHINRLIKPKLIDPYKVIDTMLISRLIDYAIPTPKGARFPHSLEAWGIRLGLHKGRFDAFEEFSPDMVDYWNNDLDITLRLYQKFWSYLQDKKTWGRALRCEHDVTVELVRTNHYGFPFDKEKAEGLLVRVKDQMVKLEEMFQIDFPPVLKLHKTLRYSVKKDGTEFKSVINARENCDMVKVMATTSIATTMYPSIPEVHKTG